MKQQVKFEHTKFSSAVLESAIAEIRTMVNGFSDRAFITRSVESDETTVEFDSDAEFFTGYDNESVRYSSYSLLDTEKNVNFYFHYSKFYSTSVEIELPTPVSIVKAMRTFIKVKSEFHEPPPDHSEPPKPVKIFLGHGGSSDWRIVKDELQDQHGWPVEAYETGARAGHVIRDILESMLNASSFAVLVLTKEDETVDGSWQARQNVIHEAGLFQGRLGFSRAIMVVEKGVTTPSNVDGVQYIPYETGHVKSTLTTILATLRREFPDRR